MKNVKVGVIYKDLSHRIEKLEDIDKLPKDEVLIISVLAPDPQKEGELRRIVASYSLDHYVLCRRRWGGADWVMLFGYDDGDYAWRRLSNSWELPNAKVETGPPLGYMHVVFDGINVKEDIWKKALNLFNLKKVI